MYPQISLQWIYFPAFWVFFQTKLLRNCKYLKEIYVLECNSA
jgi:hypothetical protein